MWVLITIISIYTIAAISIAINLVLRRQLICPICAGTALTWLWMLALKMLGYNVDTTIVALLIGGSVVGIAYQLEKRLSNNYSPIAWKLFFIPLGFTAAYMAMQEFWGPSLLLLSILFVSAMIVTSPRHTPEQNTTKKLEKEMERCC